MEERKKTQKESSRWLNRREKGFLCAAIKKGLSFFLSLLYKYNANNRQARRRGEERSVEKSLLLIYRLLIRAERKDGLMAWVLLFFHLISSSSPFCPSPHSRLAICFHCLLSFFFISHCKANNGYFSKAILVGFASFSLE